MKTLAIEPAQIFPLSIPQAAALQPDPRILALIPGVGCMPPGVLQADRLLIPDQLPLVPTRRLVVLVPAGELDETVLARRVWQLAESSGFNILYLALAPTEAQVAYQRRRLAELAAITVSKAIRVQSIVSTEKSWHQALEKILYPGDLLVCLAGYLVPERWVMRVPLGDRLAQALSLPVYMLGGLKLTPLSYWQPRLKELSAWIASIVLLAVFFFIQLGIDSSTAKPASTIMICLSILAELYLLMKINEWIG